MLAPPQPRPPPRMRRACRLAARALAAAPRCGGAGWQPDALAAPVASVYLPTPWHARWTGAAAAPADQPPPAPPSPPPPPFSLDFSTLAALVAAVRAQAVPGRVDAVAPVDRTTVALRLTVRTVDADAAGGDTEPLWLHIGWGHPPRLAAGPPPPRGGAPASVCAFAEALSADLRGAVLVGARLARPWERVARLDFAERAGGVATRMLLLEAGGGRVPALALAQAWSRPDGDGEGDAFAPSEDAPPLAGAKKKRKPAPALAPPTVPPPPPSPSRLLALSPGRAPLRKGKPLEVGRRYVAPPPQPGLAPTPSETVGVWAANLRAAAAARVDAGRDGSLASALVGAFRGVSPAAAAALCAAARADPGADPVALAAADWAALHSAWTRWLTAVAVDGWRLREGEGGGAGADVHGGWAGGGDAPVEPSSRDALVALAAAVDAAAVADAVSGGVGWGGCGRGGPRSPCPPPLPPSHVMA